MKGNWIPLLGEFEERGNSLVFLGKEIDYDFENEKRKAPSIGTALHSQRFSGGQIAAVVEFARVDEQTACELVLHHDPNSGFFVNAGLGGGYNMFNIRHYDGKKWTYHRQIGDRANIRPKRKYELKAIVRGSYVSLSVDDVTVAAVDLPYGLPDSQIGVWCLSRSEIRVPQYRVETQKPNAFVIMQFSSPYNEVYTEVIRGVCRELGLDVIRADEEVGPGLIIADVARKIVESKVVIAEITPANPNVYYEVGYAHALSKPTILIAERQTHLPFDVSPLRTLFYENTINGKSKLEDSLRKHLSAILSPK